MDGNLTAEKLQKKIQEDRDEKFREYAKDQIRNLHIIEELGIPRDRSIEFLQLLIIREIADSLYSEDGITVAEQLNWIDTHLSMIIDCTIRTKEGSFLQIIGNVSTSDY